MKLRLPERFRSAWLAYGIAMLAVLNLIAQWRRNRPMWVDEEMIALNLRDRSWSELTGPLWLNQGAPLGWVSLERLLLTGFGTSELVLRAVPAAFAIATLLLAAHLGSRWMRPVSAAIFVLLCSAGRFISAFPLEIKHYSSDVFIGLFLPALTVWVLTAEPGSRSSFTRRLIIWWIAATGCAWLSVAAALIVPGCALLMCIAVWKRGRNSTALVTLLAGGLIFVAAGVAHYQLSIQFVAHNSYLRQYWQAAYPPPDANIVRRIRWLLAQLHAIAVNPGGTLHPWMFWLSFAGGILMTASRDAWLASAIAVAPVSAFLWGALGLAPLADRLSLWIVPSLYAGVALAIDSGERGWLLRDRNWRTWICRIVPASIAVWVATGVIVAGVRDLSTQPYSKHSLDDRAAVRYLIAAAQSGDAILTTQMGLPAIWWYGGVDVAPPNLGRSLATQSIPILRTGFRSGDACGPGEVPPTLAGAQRALVYLGFDSRNPPGFQEFVLDELSRRGRLTAYRRFAEEGVVAIFNLTEPPVPWTPIAAAAGDDRRDVQRPSGCVGFFPAMRW